MRCPDCNKEVSNNAFCPYCGATIHNSTQTAERATLTSAKNVHDDVKPLFSNALLAFAVSAACIVLWYFLTSSVCVSMIGAHGVAAFSYAFTAKILVTLVLGLLTAIALAFSNKIAMLHTKTVCIILCVVFSVISYLVLISVGADSKEISAEIYALVVVSKRTLNFFLALCMPLTCGGVFIASISRKKNIAIKNIIIVSAVCLVLSFALSYISIGFLSSGLAGILFCIIAPVVAFIVSIFLK